MELGLTQSIVQAVEALGLESELRAALLAPFVPAWAGCWCLGGLPSRVMLSVCSAGVSI